MKKILVLGDIMLDRYTYVRTSRRAAEAHIPVWDQLCCEVRPGGAANIASNIQAFAPNDEVSLCGIMGMESFIAGGVDNYSMLRDHHGIATDLVINGTTMVKHRFVDFDTNQFLFRHDNFLKFDTGDIKWFESAVLPFILKKDFDMIVLSDYDKGTVTPKLVSHLRDYPITVIDSKRRDLRMFEGMTVLKVNEPEYSEQVSSKIYSNFTKFFDYCVVTKGENGADLIECEQLKSTVCRYITHTERFPVEPILATDVTGCGDTFTAALSVELLRSRDIRQAVKFGNYCAGKKVQKFGTSIPDLDV